MNVRLFYLLAFLLAWNLSIVRGSAADFSDFDRANKLYEQGRFGEAATAFEALTRPTPGRANIWFNLGNAYYKTGQAGRAIAAYRMAERLDPRDIALRANLQFVREKVYGDSRSRLPWWKRAVRLGTLNEWAALSAIFLWAGFATLVYAELAKRNSTRVSALLLMVAAIAGGAVAASNSDLRPGKEAIITAQEVTLRFGPLEDSQPAFQLRDGAELSVLDHKREWLFVRDTEGRSGWMPRRDAWLLPPVFLPTS